jgi:hypothetical protein
LAEGRVPIPSFGENVRDHDGSHFSRKTDTPAEFTSAYLLYFTVCLVFCQNPLL